MASMFNRFWGSQEKKCSWSSSRPATTNASFSGTSNWPTPTEPPAEAAGLIASLKDKSVDELQKLVSDKHVYEQFLHSLDQVKIQNNLRDELCKENMLLVEENLRKEPRIVELRNQCKIIRTSELVVARERLNGLENQKEEMFKLNSPESLLHRIQKDVNEIEEESENLHQQILAAEIDLGAFLQNYKKLRTSYHRKTLIHLAARSSHV